MRGIKRGARSDALVLFGASGDLAYKMIFPALYAMVRRGVLDTPVIGVASSNWDVAQLRDRAMKSIKKSGAVSDRRALRHLLSLLRYVNGDYNDDATFEALKKALGHVRRRAYYLAIPPALFGRVIKGLGAAGLARRARVIVEQPFGRDLASARKDALARARTTGRWRSIGMIKAAGRSRWNHQCVNEPWRRSERDFCRSAVEVS